MAGPLEVFNLLSKIRSGERVAAPLADRLALTHKQALVPIPELTAAAKLLREKQITREEYELLVDLLKPITPYAHVPLPTPAAEGRAALRSNQQPFYGAASDWAPGTEVGLRLDIPAYTNHNKWVNTIHNQEKGGVAFAPVSSVENAKLFVPQGTSLSIADRTAAAGKTPFARIKGNHLPTTEEQALAEMRAALDNPEWAQIGMDPERHAYFYDRATRQPIIGADKVIQSGPLVMGKNPKYADKDEFKYAGGGPVKMQAGGALARFGELIKNAASKPAANRLGMTFKEASARVPALEEAAQMLSREEITRADYEILVQLLKPVTPYIHVPLPATKESAVNALNAAQKGNYGAAESYPKGTDVGLRLDIPAYTNHGVWVNSIHNKGDVAYGNVAQVKNATLDIPQGKALATAMGKKKGPYAQIKGAWEPISEEEAFDKAQGVLANPNWAQIGMDPTRHGYFYDRTTMDPIIGAEEALQIGPLVLGKNPRYGKKDDFKFAEGGSLGQRIKELESRAGMSHESPTEEQKRGQEGVARAEAAIKTMPAEAITFIPDLAEQAGRAVLRRTGTRGAALVNETPPLVPGLKAAINKAIPWEQTRAPDGKTYMDEGKGSNEFIDMLNPAYFVSPAAPFTAAGKGLSALRAGARAVERFLPSLEGTVLSPGAGPLSRVVKDKGGNWINNNVEKNVGHQLYRNSGSGDIRETLGTFRENTDAVTHIGPTHPDIIDRNNLYMADLIRKSALNDFADNQLTKYIKNDMGTLGDPLRLAVDAWPEQQAKLLAEKQSQIDKAIGTMERIRQQRGVTPEMMTRSQARIRELEKEKELVERRIGLHVDPEPNLYLDPVDSGMTPAGKTQRGINWESLSDDAIEGGSYLDRLPYAKDPSGNYVNDFEQLRQAYYTPGKIVDGYDQVVEYLPATADKGWSVKVRAVADSRGIPYPEGHVEGRIRQHSTEPHPSRYPSLNKEGWKINKINYSLLNKEEQTKRLQEMGGDFAVKNPEAVAHELNSYADLGFPHLRDEIYNATNPESGLPKELLINPEHLAKWSMPQAVEHVDKINAWRASQKAVADLNRANNSATVLHKDYPEHGVAWKELKQPTSTPLPEGYTAKPSVTQDGESVYSIHDKDGKLIAVDKDPVRWANRNDKSLQEALKYEGEQLQHCVGGYCPKVADGSSRIFSLRDAAGKPQVTIETLYEPRLYSDLLAHLDGNKELADDYLARGYQLRDASTDNKSPLMHALELAKVPKKEVINQIKGLQNGKPDEKYMPMIRDFVKSGNWADVGDLKHTDLTKIDMESDLAKALVSKGLPVPKYASSEEITQLLKQEKLGVYTDSSKKTTWINNDHPDWAAGNPEGMKAGGSVKQVASLHPTVAKIDALYKRVKMADGGSVKMQAGSPAFDPEGKDYDMDGAVAAGLKADETGHWPSRDPKTGLLLKGRGHETFSKTLEGEEKAGMRVYKGESGRWYSKPNETPKFADGGSVFPPTLSLMARLNLLQSRVSSLEEPATKALTPKPISPDLTGGLKFYVPTEVQLERDRGRLKILQNELKLNPDNEKLQYDTNRTAAKIQSGNPWELRTRFEGFNEVPPTKRKSHAASILAID